MKTTRFGGVAVALVLTAMLAACAKPSLEQAVANPQAKTGPAHCNVISKEELSAIIGIGITARPTESTVKGEAVCTWDPDGTGKFSLLYTVIRMTKAQYEQRLKDGTILSGVGETPTEHGLGVAALRGGVYVSVQGIGIDVPRAKRIDIMTKVANKLLEKVT